MTLQESSLSRVYNHIQNHDVGIITAFRGAEDCGSGRIYTKAENIARNKSLLLKLRSKGHGVTIVKGSYIENYGSQEAKEVGEQSFIAVDLKDNLQLKNNLERLGKEFEQDAILFIPKGGKTGALIGTNHCPYGYPGFKKAIKLKNPLFGKSGEFMTRVNGRPFIIKEEVEYVSPPQSISGRWGIRIGSEKPWEDLVE